MIVKLYAQNNDPATIQHIVRVLEDGGVVAYPTDSTYALGCSCLKERAVERICRIKGLDPEHHPLSIVCADLSHISQFAKVDNMAFRLLKQYLPGPFTFILPPSRQLPRIFRHRRQVGIRIPAHPLVRQLCEALGHPILSTTVPWSEGDEQEYLTDPSLIDERWGDKLDLVIDAGIGGTQPSTVVDCTDSSQPVVVRQGLGVFEE